MLTVYRSRMFACPPLPATLPDGRPWPKISVVTPSYNQGQYIEETIVSVLEQGYPNVEHIVVDGASTDSTAAVLDKYRDRLACAIQEPDSGQSDAINKGMRLATGDIVTWLNSDDLLAPGALAAAALAFAMSGADMVAGMCELYKNGQYLMTHITSCPDGPLPAEEISDLYNGWQSGKFFYQPEVFFTRDLWTRAGGHVREDLHYCMDVELWLRFACHGARLHVIGAPLAMFRVHEDQKTNNLAASPTEYLQVANVWRQANGLPPVSAPGSTPETGPLRVAFVNDIGFIYGAGIAHHRLYQSFCATGHQAQSFSLGFQLSEAQYQTQKAAMLQELAVFAPDLVVCGNLHGARADADLLNELTRQWPTVFCMHDLWLLTGHCPHPSFVRCDQARTGCDAACPVPDTYPALEPERIRPAWQAKREALQHPRLLVLGNSRWTIEQHRRLAPEARAPGMLTCCCNEAIFHPGERQAARAELHLEPDVFAVLLPMVDFSSPFKGALEGLQALRASAIPNMRLLCFGVVEEAVKAQHPELMALGYIHDPAMVARVYRAVDVVISFSHAETFGQTLMEGAMCGTPGLAYGVTGLKDAVTHGVTGLLAGEENPDTLIALLRRLHQEPELRQALGCWAALHARNTRSLVMGYRSAHLAVQAAGLLPPGRLKDHTSFSLARVAEASQLCHCHPAEDTLRHRCKERLRSLLPHWTWELLRRSYRMVKPLK